MPYLKKTGTVNPTAGDTQVNASGIFQDSNGDSLQLSMTSGALSHYSASLEIMELRRAQALLRYYEAANRGGHRYVEQLLGIWGVVSDDARLQIPQYLGGGKQAVQMSEVLSHGSVLDSTDAVEEPSGSLAGKGLSMGKTNRFKKSFKEHGIVLGLMSLLPRTGYCDGIEKYWRKADRFDFFTPQLQHIGEQEIQQSEIYHDPTGTDKDDVFGYTPRYAEYKFKNDRISGLFATSFDYWHCTRRFGSAPALNEAFIQADPAGDEMNRIFAVESGTDNVFAQIYNRVTAIRPMSLYSTPV